jgi:hypothetical protein
MNDEQFEIIQELLSGIYVQLARIYDTLIITLDKLGGDAISLSQEHELGHLLGPAPLLVESEQNANIDQQQQPTN